MKNTYEGVLPRPNQQVKIRTTRWHSSGRLGVEYEATPAELKAAGIVTPYMEEKIISKKPGARLDERGRHFRIYGDGTSQCAVWQSGGVVTLTYDIHVTQAMELPGVRELHPDGIPEAEAPRRTFREVAEQIANVALEGYGIGSGQYVDRTRPVGRFRRVVEWAVIGKLIVPDWGRIRAEGRRYGQ